MAYKTKWLPCREQCIKCHIFVLTPDPRSTPHGLVAEQGLPNYLNILLVHVMVDHSTVAVLLPSVTSTSSVIGPTPNQATFAARCHAKGNATASGSANVNGFLGPSVMKHLATTCTVSRHPWMAVTLGLAKYP
jgi:hypothetical protein